MQGEGDTANSLAGGNSVFKIAERRERESSGVYEFRSFMKLP